MNNKLLSTLKKDERKLVKGLAIKKGSVIYQEGETCSNIGIVLSGRINVESYSFSGSSLIYNVLKANDIFGINLIFSSDTKYKGNVVAIEDSTVALIEKDNLIYLLQNNKNFLTEYLKVQSDFTKNLNSTIKLLSYDSAEDRLTYYLYAHNGEIEFKSITSLADELRLKRETLSRLISKMIKDKKLIKEKHKLLYK